VIAQSDPNGLTIAFVDAPFKHHSSYELTVNKHYDNATWIFFGIFP